MAKKTKKSVLTASAEVLASIEVGPIKKRTAAFCEDRIMGFQQMLSEAPKAKGVRSPVNLDPVVELAAYRVSQLQAFRALVKEAQTTPESAKGKKRGARERDAIAPPPANNWIPLGPSTTRQGQVANRTTTSGRVRGLSVSPDGLRVYAATANGGVWRSEDQGDSWISLMDRYDENPQSGTPADTLACGAIAVHFKTRPEEDFIVVGSGEGTINVDRYFGVGPITSRDGGRNWQTETTDVADTSLLGRGFFQLAMHPQNPETIVGATTTGIYRRESAANNRWHWVKKSLPGAAANSVVTSVVLAENPATRAVTFYAASCNIYQNPPQAGFVGIYSSPDGHTWTATPLPAGLAGISQRISLAIQSDNPSVLYAFCQNGQVWRFAAGAPGTWVQVGGPKMPAPASVIGTQGWYDLSIAVAPDNVNRIYLGGSSQGAISTGALGAVPPGEWAGSIWRLDLTVTPAAVTVADADYIGGSVHADCHVLVFTPGDANKLWVGCDGGVFYSENPTANGMVFTSKNHGLQTLCINSLTNHPKHESTVFCGTQDNGGLRYTGEAAWLYSSPGDSGVILANWNDPYQVIAHYTNHKYHTGIDGAGRTPEYTNYIYHTVNTVPLETDAAFYAPFVTTPPSGVAAEADRVAFGSLFVHVNDKFGANAAGDWTQLSTVVPNAQIRALCFQSYRNLYAGTRIGSLFRFIQNPADGTWSNIQLDTLGPDAAHQLMSPHNAPITCIAANPADPSGNSIYITFGRFLDYRHVWHFDGTNWSARSGPAADAPTALLNVQFNSIVVDPRHPQMLYAGADIGVWRSLDSGNNWQPFSQGLPDAPVMDLKIYHEAARNVTLLRAGLHGRGIFERDLNLDTDTTGAAVPPAAAVQLYLRSTQTDSGRYPLDETLHDPTDPTGPIRTAVSRFNSPDIRVDAPDPTTGRPYQAANLNFVDFIDKLTDRSNAVARHPVAKLANRVHVQVQNRGVVPADDVVVTLLIAPVTGVAPNYNVPLLPANYAGKQRAGEPIGNNDWHTVGTVKLDGVRVSFPQIAGFDLTTELIQQATGSGGATHFALLALAHHSEDAFPAAGVADPNALVRGERLAAMKVIETALYAGPIPGAAPTGMATLPGYVAIPDTATRAGAPVDTILMRALRQNDLLFAHLISNFIHAPQGFVYTEGTVANPVADRCVYADQIDLNIPTTTLPGTPLLWMAKEKIYLNALLDATGAGAAAGAAGDYGGGGGAAGAGADGGLCRTSRVILPAATGTANGAPADETWSSRALIHPALCRGGAGGGGAQGGRGGGIICLFAPTIEFGPTGQLRADGASPTAGDAGGGGGGVIILIAHEFINVHEVDGADRNVFANGGAKSGSAGIGGLGIILKKQIE